MPADFLDRLSRRQSVIHQLPPRWKVLGAGALVVAILATPITLWPAWVVEAAVLMLVYAAAGLPWSYLLRRLLWVAPFLTLVAVGIPLSRGLSDGWTLAAQIVVRGALCLTVMITLVATTRFACLLATLASFRVPPIFIWILAFMYRYMFVLADELQTMRRAKAARTFRSSRWSEMRLLANFVGILFVRSCERAERVYAAMCARGWNGQPLTPGQE